MKSSFIKTAVMAATLACATAPALAAPINFSFELAFTSGLLAGQTALGSFSVSGDDCPALVCDGTFTAAGTAGGATGSLLSFAVTVAGTTFGASDDSGYPDFPVVSFTNNDVTGIDFLADAGWPSLAISVASATPGGPLLGSSSYVDAQGNASLGAVSMVSAVPEPSSLALLVGGLLVAGGLRAGRRSGAAQAS